MEQPRWLVDEMLGRLCRYLRFLGSDAEYVRGQNDDEIVVRCQAEARRLITRDRALAGRLPGAVLLTRTDIAGQVAQLRALVPSLPRDVSFVRCSLCNGLLASVQPATLDEAALSHLPPPVRTGVAPLYQCRSCRHLYWEGSHTRAIQEQVRRWLDAER